jgi:hypothetical protein
VRHRGATGQNAAAGPAAAGAKQQQNGTPQLASGIQLMLSPLA